MSRRRSFWTKFYTQKLKAFVLCDLFTVTKNQESTQFDKVTCGKGFLFQEKERNTLLSAPSNAPSTGGRRRLLRRKAPSTRSLITV